MFISTFVIKSKNCSEKFRNLSSGTGPGPDRIFKFDGKYRQKDCSTQIDRRRQPSIEQRVLLLSYISIYVPLKPDKPQVQLLIESISTILLLLVK